MKKSTFNLVFGIASFVALFLFGVITLLGAFGVTWGFLDVLKKVADLLISICLIVTAYGALNLEFFKKNKNVWLIIYWVCVALALVGGISAFF